MGGGAVGESKANIMKNVVQARLIAARINTTANTEHCYVSIEQLDSIFTDRASNVYDGQASMSLLRGSFASLVKDEATTVTFKDDYPVVTQYIDPIRRVDRLNVTIRDQDGETIERAGTGDKNFLVLRFVCRKPNL